MPQHHSQAIGPTFNSKQSGRRYSSRDAFSRVPAKLLDMQARALTFRAYIKTGQQTLKPLQMVAIGENRPHTAGIKKSPGALLATSPHDGRLGEL